MLYEDLVGLRGTAGAGGGLLDVAILIVRDKLSVCVCGKNPAKELCDSDIRDRERRYENSTKILRTRTENEPTRA